MLLGAGSDDDRAMTGGATDVQIVRAQAPTGRVVGVDIARCLALIGMMATHILAGVQNGEVTWTQQLAGGRSAALFATLAGVSLALVTGRTNPLRGRALAAGRAGILARAAVIGVIGLILGSFDSGVAVILAYYAVLFLLAIPFLGLGWKPLAVLAGAWAVIGPLLSHLVRRQLAPPTNQVASVEQLFADPVGMVRDLLLTGYYPAAPWLAYILAGLAVGRLALHRPRVAGWLVAVGATVATVSWALSWLLVYRLGGYEVLERTIPPTAAGFNDGLQVALVHGLYGTTPTTSWWWEAVVAPHSTTPFDLLHTIGTSLLVLGGALLLGRLASRAFAVVFAAGAMTLTVYTAHVFALSAELGPPRSVSLYAWHVGAALVLSALWRVTFGQGPLERVAAAGGAAAGASVRAVR